jgi:hypothetical protein
MKLIDKISKFLTPIFKIIGALEIIIAVLYMFNIVQPTNPKFDLVTSMLGIGLFLLLVEYNPKKQGD